MNFVLQIIFNYFNHSKSSFQQRKNHYCKKCLIECFGLLSPEGYCLKCESLEFCDRFHICIYCKKGINYEKIICNGCSKGLRDWLLDVFLPHSTKSENKKSIIYNAIDNILSKDYKRIINKTMIQDIVSGEEKWKGFYDGISYFIFEPELISKKIKISDDINQENSCEMLICELEKNFIFIFDEIQFKEK
jgi:hypothetical protein